MTFQWHVHWGLGIPISCSLFIPSPPFLSACNLESGPPFLPFHSSFSREATSTSLWSPGLYSSLNHYLLPGLHFLLTSQILWSIIYYCHQNPVPVNLPAYQNPSPRSTVLSIFLTRNIWRCYTNMRDLCHASTVNTDDHSFLQKNKLPSFFFTFPHTMCSQQGQCCPQEDENWLLGGKNMLLFLCLKHMYTNGTRADTLHILGLNFMAGHHLC